MTRKRQRDGRAARNVFFAFWIEKPRAKSIGAEFLLAAVDAGGGSAGSVKMKRKTGVYVLCHMMKEVH